MNINVATDGLATTTAAPFEVERLGAKLGAAIHGLDLKNGMDPARYAGELEKLLTDLAIKSKQIKDAEGKK